MLLDLVGQKYGKLIVLSEVPPIVYSQGNKMRRFQCLCDCGNTAIARMSNLRSGHTTSCGCILKKNNPRYVDRTGSVIGELTITGVARTKGQLTWWNCSCACGKTAVLRFNQIMRQKDCGCGASGNKATLADEVWKFIPGMEDRYMASTMGRIKSVVYGEGRLMQPFFNRKGYPCVTLQIKNGKKLRSSIHRLIAKTFIPESVDKPQVNHKDGIKTNNRVENLEWVTNLENRRHAVMNGLHVAPSPKLGSQNNLAKLREDQVREIRKLAKQLAPKKIAQMYGVDPTTIYLILKRKTWQHI